MRLGRQLLVGALVATAVGAAASGLLTSGFAGENLGGDFADQATGVLDVGCTALVFTIFAAIFAAPAALLISVAIVARWLARRGRNG